MVIWLILKILPQTPTPFKERACTNVVLIPPPICALILSDQSLTNYKRTPGKIQVPIDQKVAGINILFVNNAIINIV